MWLEEEKKIKSNEESSTWNAQTLDTLSLNQNNTHRSFCSICLFLFFLPHLFFKKQKKKKKKSYIALAVEIIMVDKNASEENIQKHHCLKDIFFGFHQLQPHGFSFYFYVFVSINNDKNKFKKYHSSAHPSKYMCWCTHGWWTYTLLPKTKDQLSWPTTLNKEKPRITVWESSQFYRWCFYENSRARTQSTRAKHGSAHTLRLGKRKRMCVKCCTILGQGPPHDLREFWRSVEAACHSWQGMCLTTALQWHLIRTMAVQGGQGPGWHACRQLWLQPWGRGLSHADSHGWQFSPAWTGKRDGDDTQLGPQSQVTLTSCSLLSHSTLVCLSVCLFHNDLSFSSLLLSFTLTSCSSTSLFHTDLLFFYLSLSHWPLVLLPLSLSHWPLVLLPLSLSHWPLVLLPLSFTLTSCSSLSLSHLHRPLVLLSLIYTDLLFFSLSLIYTDLSFFSHSLIYTDLLFSLLHWPLVLFSFSLFHTGILFFSLPPSSLFILCTLCMGLQLFKWGQHRQFASLIW